MSDWAKNEEQAEELDALESVLMEDMQKGDNGSLDFLIKDEEDEDLTLAVLSVCWPDEYPNELPDISLDAFANRAIPAEVKQDWIDQMSQLAEDYIGVPVTMVLVDTLRDVVREWAAQCAMDRKQLQISEKVEQNSGETVAAAANEHGSRGASVNSAQGTGAMSKKAKAKAYERTAGKCVRGLDWVDIISHLSKV